MYNAMVEARIPRRNINAIMKDYYNNTASLTQANNIS